MKNLKSRISFILVIFIHLQSLSLAQSDYAIVQKMKTDYEEIKDQISDATNRDELTAINANIEELILTYSKHSELLDKALFPEKYEEMIDNLNGMIASKENNFASVEVFQAEVSDLQQRVDTLSMKNSELEKSINEITQLFDKSKKETSNLSSIISDLKIALQKRDLLIINMVDSLMPPVMREKPLLSSEDKENITWEFDKNNVIRNIKITISDNIKYLDLTSLQPDDLTEIQGQQYEFADTWAKIGPRLAEVYSDDTRRSNDLFEIDSLFKSWTIAIEKEAWQSIKEEFNAKGIVLDDFMDGQEFVGSMNQYIENEKKNIDKAPEETAKTSLEEFADRTWKDDIEPKWAPYLIENGMLTEADTEVIEENIEVWRSEIYPSKWWLWIILSGFVFSGLVILLRLLKKGSLFYDQVVE